MRIFFFGWVAKKDENGRLIGNNSDTTCQVNDLKWWKEQLNQIKIEGIPRKKMKKMY
jgi:hypothetical protein